MQQIKAKSEPVDVPYAMPQTKCNKAMNVGKDSCNLKASWFPSCSTIPCT